MPMDDDEIKRIERLRVADLLERSGEKTIRETLRQAESFLSAQLTAGLAADQRAMNLAVVLAAVIAALVGGTASLIAADVKVWPHVLSIILMLSFFSVALAYAVHAARPTSFEYAGSNPKFWASDVEQGKSLVRSLAEQAAWYAQGITENSGCLADNHKSLKSALWCASYGAFLGALTEFVIVLIRIGQLGFRAVLLG